MSGRELHARASALFLELRALPPPEREAALERSAGADEALRREVASLLEHDAPDTAGASGAPGAPGPPEDLHPERLGPYRVERRIGRGGSGQVFLALQDEPIQRRVAIKVVPQATLSPELAARFEVERRALEATEHPNIPRILDAGRTPDGLPYLVMELVEGPPITDYCRAVGLSVAERVALLLEVAGAVQHAHQRGVIHRDLKPANVLVAERDGRPAPHVVDFGIAKPVAGTFAAGTPVTSGLPIGTPAYMAPEQTGSGPVDTRADVYALGALLYELVAGRPPIRGEESDADPLETLRRVRESVPAAASRARAAAGLAPLSRALARDLDGILARALEKDPERRYPTVAALADDLRRLLRREPVEARAPTFGYRAARFVERNRLLVGGAASVVVALVLGVLGLLLGLREARRLRREALAQEETQRSINDFLLHDLLLEASPDAAGPEAPATELLRRAGERVDERFPRRPLVAAAVHQALASVYAELGEFPAAERHVARALELRAAHAGADSPETVRSEIARGNLLGLEERYEEAALHLTPVVARARLVLGPDDPDLYTALNDLGVSLESLGRVDEALPLLREALIGRRRLHAPNERAVLETMSNLALAIDQTGDTETCLAMLHEALELAETAPRPQRYTLLSLNNNVGATYQDLNRDLEAEPYLRRSEEIARALLGSDHPVTRLLGSNLAALEAELGDPEQALPMYAEVIEARERSLGPHAQGTLIARYGYWDAMRLAGRAAEAAEGLATLVADTRAALGLGHWLTAQTTALLARALLENGRPAEARPLAREALTRLEELYGPQSPRAATARAVLEAVGGN